jgi:hypothetical protein
MNRRQQDVRWLFALPCDTINPDVSRRTGRGLYETFARWRRDVPRFGGMDRRADIPKGLPQAALIRTE